MAKKKRNLMEAYEQHKSTGNNQFFTLKDDKDSAIVRFLYKDIEELDWFIVHEVKIGEKKRWVECTEEEDCPLCAALGSPKMKLFIQMVVKGKEEEVYTFERGQQFAPIMAKLFDEYGDLTQHQFQITRHGKAGDSSTTYAVDHLTESAIDHDVLPERQEFLGPDGFVMSKSHEEMRQILNGNFGYKKVDTPPRRKEPATDVDVF